MTQQYVKDNGLEAVDDSDEIKAAIGKAICENPKVVEDYLGGNEKSMNFLFGQVMRATKGKSDPQTIRGLLIAALRAKR